MSLFEGRDLLCIRGERRVFADLNFTLDAGGALFLVGPNGSGKSSLLRLLSGLLRPAAGDLLWGGAPIAKDTEAHRARLHYVGHLDAVKPVLTARENLSFWAALHGAVDQSRVAQALDGFDLGPLAELPGRVLSAGQKHRLALTRLLAAPAELWLLDEPTVGLDTASLDRLTRAVARHRAEGGRVVVATHASLDMPGAETLSLEAFAAAAVAPLGLEEDGW
jgi:heme exporter protein A